jgi:hypothetical protein
LTDWRTQKPLENCSFFFCFPALHYALNFRRVERIELEKMWTHHYTIHGLCFIFIIISERRVPPCKIGRKKGNK